jgi:lipopolysaccharide export LptBFGC system permease protein LptF
MRPDPEDDTLSDEIKREDGLQRYWFFYNGEWAETIFGLLAAGAAILWCFLYILGYGETIVGHIFGGLAVFGFVGWFFVFKSLQSYESSGWRKERKESKNAEKWKVAVAAGLWIFIILFFGTIILMRRR